MSTPISLSSPTTPSLASTTNNLLSTTAMTSEEAQTVVDLGKAAKIQLDLAKQKIEELIAAVRVARESSDVPKTCEEFIAKIQDLTTASVTNNLTEILAVATSLAQTQSTVKCTANEKQTLQTKVTAIDKVSQNVDALIEKAENVLGTLVTSTGTDEPDGVTSTVQTTNIQNSSKEAPAVSSNSVSTIDSQTTGVLTTTVPASTTTPSVENLQEQAFEAKEAAREAEEAIAAAKLKKSELDEKLRVLEKARIEADNKKKAAEKAVANAKNSTMKAELEVERAETAIAAANAKKEQLEKEKQVLEEAKKESEDKITAAAAAKVAADLEKIDAEQEKQAA